MKATFVLALAGLVAAQNLDGIAPCVKSCIEKAIAGAGCTGTEAQIAVCACKPDTQAKLLSPVTQCATENKCNTADLLKAQSIAAEQCKNLPTGSGTASGSSTASGTATGSHTASGSSTGSATTTVVVPSLTSTGTGGVPTNSMNQTTSSGATGTTKAPTTTGGSGGSQTSSTGAPTSTGAAAGGPVAGALAVVLAAAFAL